MSAKGARTPILLLPPGPEAALIRLAACWPASPAPSLLADLTATVDGPKLLEMALEHRLVPPLVRMLTAGGLTPAPALRDAEREAAMRNLRQTATTLALLKRLEEVGCRTLVLKGQALSVQIYGRQDIRTSNDIDLMIDPSKAVAAHQVMIAEGFVPRYPVPIDQLSLTTKDQIYNGATGLVELHWRLFDNSALLPWDFETLWADRELVTLSGDWQVPTLRRDRHLLYQTLHGLLHGWTRLRWLADLAVPLQRIDDMERVIDLAGRTGMMPAMLHTMGLARDVLGVEPAVPIAPRQRHLTIARSIDHQIIRLARTRNTVGYEVFRGWFHRRLAEKRLILLVSPGGKAVWGELRSSLIGVGDLIDVRLPRSLTWLYVLLRPLLLLRRMLARARGLKRKNP